MEAKSLYETTLVQKYSYSNNSKNFQYISSLKEQSVTMFLSNQSTSDDLHKAELFNAYFSVFTTNSNDYSGLSTTTGDLPTLQGIVINDQLVYNGLCALDTSKAAGIDKFKPILFKN